MRQNFIAVAGTAAVAAFALTGCVNSEEPSQVPATQQQPNNGTVAPPAGAEGAQGAQGDQGAQPGPNAHNAADVAFATQMLPHHQQGVDMAKLVPTHTANVALRTLAARIATTQQREIGQLRGWLAQWGAPATASAMPGMGGTGMGMDRQQLAQLQNARGAAFDQAWLAAMIDHHQDALLMAGTEAATGASAQARQLARDITTTQQAEIRQMQAMQQPT